jgi:S-adenosylmethionine hydrolase
VCIICHIYETWGIYHTYADQPQGTFVALIGSRGRLELALVGGNAADQLGIKLGAPVIMAWE